jgi:hypothetical protein
MVKTAAWLVVGAIFASGQVARAQTTLPINSVNDARPDLSGTWVLDPSLSTDPAQIRFGSSVNATRQAGRGGFGGFGGGRRQGGRNGSNRSAAEVLTPGEQSRLDALTNELKTSFTTLVISHHDPSFVVADTKDQAQFFQTSGASDENHVGVETVMSSAHWDGSRIVAEYVLGDRRMLTYTYTLLPRTNQLVLRVARNGDGLPRATEPEVKLVYKLATAQPTGSAREQ